PVPEPAVRLFEYAPRQQGDGRRPAAQARTRARGRARSVGHGVTANALRAICLGLPALAPLGAPLGQTASGYPNRPITLVVPFSPGTGIDILARTIGPKLS